MNGTAETFLAAAGLVAISHRCCLCAGTRDGGGPGAARTFNGGARLASGATGSRRSCLTTAVVMRGVFNGVRPDRGVFRTFRPTAESASAMTARVPDGGVGPFV